VSDVLKTSKALGDETRLSIYRLLATSHQEPLSVQSLTKHFKLHPNAIRQHLAKLEEAGLACSDTSRTHHSGRPQKVWRIKGPLRGTEFLPRDYRLLCEMLLELLSQSKISIEEVKGFGKQWGQKLVMERMGPHALEVNTGEVAQILMEQFRSWGFEPKLATVSDQNLDIRLHNCIFREVVDFHPELVCPLLHGVLEGLLSPFVGESPSALENGIAHGESSCRILVTLKPS
jgi:predicted ArsR family transcriptional regulator